MQGNTGHILLVGDDEVFHSFAGCSTQNAGCSTPDARRSSSDRRKGGHLSTTGAPSAVRFKNSNWNQG